MNTETASKTAHRRKPIAQDQIINLTQDGNKPNVSNDSTFAIQICYKFLRVLGVWMPIDVGAFSWRTVLGNISVIACYFGIGIRSIPVCLYIILDEKDPNEKLRLMIRCVFVAMGAAKYILLRSHRENIDSCIKHIAFDWLKLECIASREVMHEHARFGHRVTRICVTFTYAGATFLALLPIVLAYRRGDDTDGINATATLPAKRFSVPSHFGLSVFTKTPIYELIYSSQVIATFMLHAIAITCYSLAVVVVMHACGQLKILTGKLGELVDGGAKMTTYDSVDGRMSDIIRHHVRVLRFISSAEKMLRGICLVDLGGYTIQLCGLGYFFLVEFRTGSQQPIAICAYTTLLVTYMFNIFSFCYIGELLTEECMKVGETTYMIDWHRLPGKQSLDLGLMITMTQNPVTLTAGGAIQLSFRCFVSVVKTSIGYVNMLRTVMD